MKQGRIYKALSGFYYIYSDGQIYQTRAKGAFRKQKITPLVGDFVQFESTNLTDGVVQIIEERKNQMVRPAVANVDQAIIVSSMVVPDYADLLLDRFLVAVEALNVEPIIYISKVDLVDVKQYEVIKTKYEKIGYRVFSNLDDEKNLISCLANKLTVVMGQSGVGKSTLLNKLLGQNMLKTGEVSEALGRGRHTTRHVELVEIAGGLLADTPGFSALDLQNLEPRDLSQYFRDFTTYSHECKFRGCLHVKEPKCAVKQALEDGLLEQSRYDSYQTFLQELEQQKTNRY